MSDETKPETRQVDGSGWMIVLPPFEESSPTPDAAYKPAQAVIVPPHPEPCAGCDHPEHAEASDE